MDAIAKLITISKPKDSFYDKEQRICYFDLVWKKYNKHQYRMYKYFYQSQWKYFITHDDDVEGLICPFCGKNTARFEECYKFTSEHYELFKSKLTESNLKLLFLL